uniref:Sialin-like n=1 Tax=Diabrotica virgifera virgifera TaxID=50390 RepID=A0A6P7GTU9_DIAVI
GLVYPALQVLIAKWAPPAEKGRFVAGLMGNTLATCVTWPLVGWVITKWGWNWGFHVITVQLVVFCVVFYFVCADSPEDHKFISEEEVAFIKEAQGATVTKKKDQLLHHYSILLF